MDKVIVTEIIDGDTLTMAMQSGELDAVQGLPYASLKLFRDSDRYRISTMDTSRCFFAQLNLENPILQDYNVRRAIAMSIDKKASPTICCTATAVRPSVLFRPTSPSAMKV